MGPETPKLMVDVVIPSPGGIVLIRRGSDPFEDRWALPVGFVEVGETVETAATREAAEETGLAVELASLVGVYSDPERGPRGPHVSVAYPARVVGGDLIAFSFDRGERSGELASDLTRAVSASGDGMRCYWLLADC